MTGVAQNLKRVIERINVVSSDGFTPRLVAVSKMKSAAMIKECYDAGQRHFGENYVQQLTEKAPQLPSDISWHYIGKIQSNKAKQIVSVPNLFMVETVDREKAAASLHKALQDSGREEPLSILVQVNPAAEETKSGITSAEELEKVVEYIRDKCPSLRFKGLMVIGRPGMMEDMDKLVSYKEHLLSKYPELKELNPFELSMGMSNDFEDAIKKGSTNVRVGSTIFGARD